MKITENKTHSRALERCTRWIVRIDFYHLRGYQLQCTCKAAARRFHRALLIVANLIQGGSVTIEICSSVNSGCVDLPVVSDSCVNLTGGLSFLNKEISFATIPGGLICTFFQ